jgi:hypothetical protein
MPPPIGVAKRPETRNSTQGDNNPSAGKTREELLKATISSVHDEKTAKEFLERRCYVITGEEYSLASLSLALLHLSQTPALTKIVVDGLRATALLLESKNMESTTSKTSKAITELITPATEQLTVALTELQRATDELRGSAVSITRTADEFSENCATSTQYVLDAVSEAAAEAAEAIEASAKAQPQTPPSAQPPATQPTTYAAAAAGTHLHPAHATTLARGDSRARQVLVDKAPGADASGLEDLSEKELVEKARVALEQLAQTGVIDTARTKFVWARKLRIGGVIYEMDTAESAKWLKREPNMASFLQVFSATSVIKHHAYSILAEYVPLSFDTNERTHLAEVERDNGLETKGILHARWIKPPHRRTAMQRTAHVILCLSQLAGANSAIWDGMIIAGKRAWARKLLHEPRRCLKCQEIGATHIAATCKQTHDTCGSCGDQHRTSDCSITDPANHNCVNCKTKGHAAWDRHCPAFVHYSNQFDARHPENGYRYFPTTLDPAAWEPLQNPNPVTTPRAPDTQLNNGTPEGGQQNSWTTVERHRSGNQKDAQDDTPRGRAATTRRNMQLRGTEQGPPATGANTVPGQHNNSGSRLQQTMLDSGWAATAMNRTNPTTAQWIHTQPNQHSGYASGSKTQTAH